MESSPKTAKIFLAVGILVVVGIVGFSLYQVFRGVPLFKPPAPPAPKVAKKIGIIYFRQQSDAIDGMKEGLKELGYSDILYEEIVNIPGPTMEAEIEQAAQKLVEDRVDLIFATLEHQARGAINVTKRMGSSIPIVFLTNFHDPVKYGLAQSFKSSGNNATGVSLDLVEVVQKQLEFLKKVKPSTKKVAVFSDGFIVPPIAEEILAELKRQAPQFGYEIVEYKTTAPPPEAEKAWFEVAQKIKPGDIDAIYHLAGHPFYYQETAESELATRLRVPMVAPVEDMVNGGHFGYSGDFRAAGKQSVKMIDKIFKGVKPADIPLEFIEKKVLLVHKGRAHIAGYEFPESMLSIAVKMGEE